jgi:leucyl/phenylalanyl-tRNA--protein transferase
MSIKFPPVENADEDGLLCIGGDLSVETLLTAYRSGIFPWFSKGELLPADAQPEHWQAGIMWWSPDPRFVILPENLNIPKSMRKILNSREFEIRFNTSFETVINECAKIKRRGQRGTWITDEMKQAYIEFHKAGYAFCGEAWKNKQLVGGFYGVRLNNCFFGESMFSKESNASKAAFLTFAEHFFHGDALVRLSGVEGGQGRLIDCQVYTEHLESLGAKMIPRTTFVKMIE